MGDRPVNIQYILTYGAAASEDAQHLMAQLKELAHLQNRQYQTLFDILRQRGNMEAAQAGEEADEALRNFLSDFTIEHDFDLARTSHYFGGPTYPDDPDSIAVFDTDFNTAGGWKQAATEPIGDFYKRARIIPAALTTEQAIGFLRQAHAVFEKEKCQPVIVELGKSSQAVKLGTEEIGALKVPVIAASPETALPYLFEQLYIQDCLLSHEQTASSKAAIGSLDL